MSLNLPKLATPKAYVLDPRTGRPASLGRLFFFAPGTSIAKPVYLGADGLSEAAQPVVLDAAGACDVFLSGSYRIEVYDANGSFLFSQDGVNSIPVETPEGNPGSLKASENLADLANKATARNVLGLAKQSTVSDTEPGLVMLNGGLGYGGDAPTYPGAPTNFNAFILVGQWEIASTAGMSNVPPGATAGILVVTRRSGDRVSQDYTECGPGGGGQGWSRTLSGAGWSPWAAAVTAGQFGVGGPASERLNWDTLTVSGLYRAPTGGSATGAPITGDNLGLIHIDISAAMAVQACWRASTALTGLPQAWMRRRTASTPTWSAWTPIYTGDNLVTDVVDIVLAIMGADAAPYAGATDMNNMILPGDWSIDNLALVTNGPLASGSGLLEVKRRSPVRVMQMFTVIGVSSGGALYQRVLHGGGWTAWRSI